MENNNNVFKPLVDIDYTGIIRPTCFCLCLGERYLSEILEQLIPGGTSLVTTLPSSVSAGSPAIWWAQWTSGTTLRRPKNETV